MVDQNIFDFFSIEKRSSQFTLKQYPDNVYLVGSVNFVTDSKKAENRSVDALILRNQQGDLYLLLGNSLTYFDRVLAGRELSDLIKKSFNLKTRDFDAAYGRSKIRIKSLVEGK